MNAARWLINAYFEALYNILVSNHGELVTLIKASLRAEIDKGTFPDWDESKFFAYLEAGVVFLDERIETYNPVGVQYAFDQISDKDSLELEFALSWYDGREEYARLIKSARQKSESNMPADRVHKVANEMIQELGAYPDQSIIAGYEEKPTLNKLPDYIVAQAIERKVSQVD